MIKLVGTAKQQSKRRGRRKLTFDDLLDDWDEQASPIRRNLSYLMVARDLSARAISMDANLHEDALRNILRGKSSNPRRDTIAAIANVFGLPPDVLALSWFDSEIEPPEDSESSTEEEIKIVHAIYISIASLLVAERGVRSASLKKALAGIIEATNGEVLEAQNGEKLSEVEPFLLSEGLTKYPLVEVITLIQNAITFRLGDKPHTKKLTYSLIYSLEALSSISLISGDQTLPNALLPLSHTFRRVIQRGIVKDILRGEKFAGDIPAPSKAKLAGIVTASLAELETLHHFGKDATDPQLLARRISDLVVDSHSILFPSSQPQNMVPIYPVSQSSPIHLDQPLPSGLGLVARPPCLINEEYGICILMIFDNMAPQFSPQELLYAKPTLTPKHGRPVALKVKDDGFSIGLIHSQNDDTVTLRYLNPEGTFDFNVAEIEVIFSIVGTFSLDQ